MGVSIFTVPKFPKELALVLAWRLASVFLVRTWYVPDEYWQSLEVAHRLVFGFGYLTWEWTNGIRGYLYPSVFAGVYKLLEMTGLDVPELLIYLPRILQAILSASADYAFYNWCGKRKWALFLILIQSFWYYTASRTLTNTAETALITIALTRYPLEPGKIKNNGWLCYAALSCVIRPTAAIIWIPLCLNHLLTTTEKKIRLIGLAYLPIGLSIIVLSTLLDSYFYGEFIFTPWEFIKMNVINNIGSFYGTQPWYWYFAIGFPVVMGINLIPFLCASYESMTNKYLFKKQRFLIALILFALSIYSVLPHKEFRFILPLVPIVTYISQDYLSRWSRKAKGVYIYLTFVVLLLGNVLPAAYLGIVHQCSNLMAINKVREIATLYPSNSSFLFLMPCHSTPLYSHVHVNVPIRFLTCEPNLLQKPNYKDEAELFFEDSAKWFQKEYLNQQVGETTKKSKLPTHIVTFDHLTTKLDKILSYYDLRYQFSHALSTDGQTNIYVRASKSSTPTVNKSQQ